MLYAVHLVNTGWIKSVASVKQYHSAISLLHNDVRQELCGAELLWSAGPDSEGDQAGVQYAKQNQAPNHG